MLKSCRKYLEEDIYIPVYVFRTIWYICIQKLYAVFSRYRIASWKYKHTYKVQERYRVRHITETTSITPKKMTLVQNVSDKITL